MGDKQPSQKPGKEKSVQVDGQLANRDEPQSALNDGRREIFCPYLKKRAEALLAPPKPGALGLTIMRHVSAVGWEAWLTEQTKFINENRLNPLHPPHREKINDRMKEFLHLDELEEYR